MFDDFEHRGDAFKRTISNFVLGVMPLICKSLSLPQILFKKSMRLVWMVLNVVTEWY
jgi:hypothetical protein